MASATGPGRADDPYDLDRFVEAQRADHERALAELRSGRKRSHWMWYVFPQGTGLGTSERTRRYAIRSVEEAEAYLRHPTLGPRLVACAEATVRIVGGSAQEVFGTPDDLQAPFVCDVVGERSASGWTRRSRRRSCAGS